MDSETNMTARPNRSAELPRKDAAIRLESTTPGKKGFYLFQYVTMLVSGLMLLTLVNVSVLALLEHWLGDAKEVSFLAQFAYGFHVYLLVSMVLAAGLHIWMRWKTSVVQEDETGAVRVFRAIFLTILALTILGALGAIVYLLVDTMLGTANETAKSMWLAILGSGQMILWSALLWWYFKAQRSGSQMVYLAVVGLVTVVVAVLLVVFPILSKRDAVIDARTSSDLEAIVAAVGTYASKNDKLPASLSEITLEDERVKSRLASYEYQVTESAPAPEETLPTDLMGDLEGLEGFDDLLSEDYYRAQPASLSYKLCATFKTDTTKEKENSGIIPLLYPSSGMGRHPAGKHCFDQTAYGKEADQGSGSAAVPTVQLGL